MSATTICADVTTSTSVRWPATKNVVSGAEVRALLLGVKPRLRYCPKCLRSYFVATNLCRVFLNSELLENGVTDDEVRWLIGRFIGYLQAQRRAGFWGWTIRAAQKLLVFNFFILPYERALVYTGDRLALAVINGELTSAISAMQKILVGRQLGYSVNPEGIVDQQRLVKGSFFAFLARIWSSHPHMTTRYVDLIAFAKSYYPAQYARFEAGNPGLPSDLWILAAYPEANPALPVANQTISRTVA